MLRGKFSIKRQLLLWLLIPQGVLWLAGAFLSYNVARHYTNMAIDDSLLQTARSIGRQIKPQDNGLIIDFPHALQLLLDDDSDERLFYTVSLNTGGIIFSNSELPALQSHLKPDNQIVFYDSRIQNESLRIVSLYFPVEITQQKKWMHVLVGKSTEARSQLSKEILIAIAAPLALLIFAMSFLVWWGINRGLRPLARLQRRVEEHSGQDPSPLQLDDEPEEVGALTSALNQLLSSTNESVARQRRFIADAAHQLRTPLAGLKSQTELAMRETTPEGLSNRLTMVHTSANRSIHLVNQLLTLARSEPDSAKGMPRVPLDLAKLIRELTAECVPRALAAGMDLGCDTDVSEAPMHGNSALLRELFTNLIENAIKYIPRGCNITARLSIEGENYVVEVEDDGAGIPDADKERVFERFYRREQTGNGCGLGMAIVKEITERHRGSIRLLDAKPHGLIVRVLLPIKAE
ncbi:sensor histidine kinase [Iodobacter sp. HSC-16F04]|uniref:histidine kinase n=1 Tax=Iodobacter violaceini TaxID=3044271 RepID=A0ABX0KZ13_9NEIS|nr:sensor histidine kinase [Iodobacter violacea]